MALLIDGHNLIGAGVFDDIHLSDEDDEAKLVARLRVWKSRHRGNITVIFDRGIPGGWDRGLSGAGVDVVFASDPVEADDLIARRLRRRPKNLVLVSNDTYLLGLAATYGVSTMRGAEFVDRFTLRLPEPDEVGAEADVQLSKDELDEWMNLFDASPTPSRKSIARPKLRPRKQWPRRND